MIFVYGGYTIHADSGYDFQEAPIFQLAKPLYHAEMNQYFNEKFSELNDLLETPDFFDIEKHPEFHPPQGMDIVNESLESMYRKCNPEGEPANLSSFCVSMGATKIYVAYVYQLEVTKGTILGPEILNLPFVALHSTYIPELPSSYSASIQELSQRGEEITIEVESARDVLEATMGAYNEYRLAYPMHQKYQEIIENLIKYRSEMKDIHRRVVNFPAKFIDASTSQCE